MVVGHVRIPDPRRHYYIEGHPDGVPGLPVWNS